MPPTLSNGKICYLEMQATDIAVSSRFYQQVFGWNLRTRGNGGVAFDDTTGMVDSVEAAVEAVVANGGEIV